MGFVYHSLDLIIHAWEYVGVLICQGRLLFINEEEEGGHTNTLRWWRERSITMNARCYPWADIRSNTMLYFLEEIASIYVLKSN